MTALEWVGALVAILVAAAIAAAGFGYAFDIVWTKLDRVIWRMAERRIRERGMVMKNQAYWWSTHEEAAIWLSCAEHMADGCYPDASVVRDQTYPRILKQLKSRVL